MFRIDLLNNTIKFTLLYSGSSSQVELIITNGRYKDRSFQSAVYTEGSLFLEGADGALLIRDNIKALYCKAISIKDIVAEHLGSRDIYMEGIDAVPSGKERDILAFLIEPSADHLPVRSAPE